MEGRKRGYDQILWLFGPDHQVTEAGASNFFVIWASKADPSQLELVTAPLAGKIILDGVTRRSVLDLARARFTTAHEGRRELRVVERTYTMLELEEASREGRLVEAFLSGTAYFITPVSAINFRERELAIPMGEDGQGGSYARTMKGWLTDIMYGNVQHEWGVVIEEDE